MKVKRDFFSLILVFIIIFVLTHLPRFSGTEGDEINLKNSNFAVGSVKRIYYGFKTGKLIAISILCK
jgi:hypothetical protein